MSNNKNKNTNTKKANVKKPEVKKPVAKKDEEVRGIKKLFSEKNLAIVITAIALVAILAVGGLIALIRYIVRDEGFDYEKSNLSKYIEFTQDHKNFTVDIEPKTVKGVQYLVTSIDGVQLNSTKTTITFAADAGRTDPSQTGKSNAEDDLAAYAATVAANADIAADVAALKTALVKATPVTIADITIPAAAHGSTYTLADGTGTATATVSAGAGTITGISGNAGEDHTFTVQVAKGTGTTKTLTFKITINTDTDKYTVTFVSES